MEKVLIVESTVSFADCLVESVQKIRGVECEVAASFNAADDILKTRGHEFFCAVVDSNLPDLQGDNVLELIMRYSHIAPIVFTETSYEQARQDFMGKAVADYVMKSEQSGGYNIEYVAYLIDRLYNNYFMKVLVISDSPIEFAVYERLLKIQRFQVVNTSAVDIVECFNAHPDIKIALIDCYDDNGLEVVSVLRTLKARDDLVILCLSDKSSEQQTAHYMKSGANDFLLKPFIVEEFNCRVNLAAELIERLERLRVSNENVNRVLRMAAHDIRGPLGGIQTAASMILAKAMDGEKRKRFLELIVENSTSMLDLLSDLLDLSAIESGVVNVEREMCNLADIINGLLLVHRMAAEKKNITIDASLIEQAVGEYDPRRLRQVFDNMVSNAVKYSPLGSTVRVSMSESAGRWTINVDDEGPGISDDDVEKLFGVFQRLGHKTTAGESSAGLGLSIAKNIVQAHGGEIGYKPSGLGGSCFFVSLPR